MQLTQHTDLALRVLLLLGAAAPRRVSSSEVARRYKLSHTHVQKVIQSLQAAGFVQTFRGRGGGVQLACPASEIGVGNVVRAVQPNLNFVECFQPELSTCVLTGGCALTHLLFRAKAAMLSELDKTTIAELIAGSPALLPLLD